MTTKTKSTFFWQSNEQVQVQVEEQDLVEITMIVQLLHEQTTDLMQFISNYCNAILDGSASDISFAKQKIMTGLTLYSMKARFMDADTQQKGYDFQDGYHGAKTIINEFQQELNKSLESRLCSKSASTENCPPKQALKEEVVQRVSPLLEYCFQVLDGGNQQTIAELPVVINRSSFNKNVVTSVMSNWLAARNHVVPRKVREIEENYKFYHKQQQELANRRKRSSKNSKSNSKWSSNSNSNSSNTDLVHAIANDIKRPLGYLPTADELSRVKPDLINGDGSDDSNSNSTSNINWKRFFPKQ
jgi:hypothetical protein